MSIRILSLLIMLFVATILLPSDMVQIKLKNCNFDSITKILGYDPKVTTTLPANNVEGGDEVTVYAHAWGDSQDSIIYFRNISLMLPGTIIGFNFRDAHRGSSLPPYWFSNFGQEGDIATLLMVLKSLVDCDIKKIHLFGHSRGGATIITMLGRLYQYTTYYSSFNKLGINKEQASAILDAIQSIVLNCPLVDTPQLIKEKLRWANLGFMSGVFSHLVLPLVTKYRAYADVPIAAARILQKNHFAIPTFIHFQKDDVIISTQNDYLLYQYLYGNNTYLTIGNEGSHMHSGRQLGRDLQPFYKKYGNAYYKNISINEDVLREAQPALNTLTTTFNNIQKYKRSGIIQYDAQELMPAWQQKLKTYNMIPVIQALGYDPQIRVYTENNPSVHNGGSVTVYVHGLGENPQTVIPYNKLNSYLLPGTVIGFDFPDVVPGTFSSNFKRLNLAQAGDIAVFSTILKIVDECGLDVIHLFGTSRGGATIVNTLGRLCQYTHHLEYQKFFNKIGINQQQVARIIEKIQKGTIILNVPLVDSNAVARSWFKWFGPFILSYVIPRFTKHKGHKDQAIDAAEIIQSKQFKILVHFEHRDERVGNSTDAAFYKAIMGPTTYLVLADDGGHLHSGYTLERALQRFRNIYGGAYYNFPELIDEGTKQLDKSPRSKNAVDQFVSSTYAEFDKLHKQKK